MQTRYLPTTISLLLATTLQLVTTQSWSANDNTQQLIQRGRYLTMTSGCNDCHTPGYMMNDGNVPEATWLTGDNFGWRGPWGTTYASNLRLFVKDLTAAQWVEAARTLKARPPMPWFNLNAMNEADLRAIYSFVVSLGEPGQQAPAYVPPGQEPSTPYALFPSPPAAQP